MPVNNDDIGFPEGQLLANGLELETAHKVGDAYRLGSDMKAVCGETTPVIERIIDRLEEIRSEARR